MSRYSVYQITCPHNVTENEFEDKIGSILLENQTETGISVTVGSFVHSLTMSIDIHGLLKYQNSTQMTISTDDLYDAEPVVIRFVHKLNRIFESQIMYHAVSPAEKVGYIG